jgi:hypothetical protein
MRRDWYEAARSPAWSALNPLRRRVIADSPAKFRRPLSCRTKSSRVGEPTHQPGGGPPRPHRRGPAAPAPRRLAELLLSRRSLNRNRQNSVRLSAMVGARKELRSQKNPRSKFPWGTASLRKVSSLTSPTGSIDCSVRFRKYAKGESRAFGPHELTRRRMRMRAGLHSHSLWIQTAVLRASTFLQLCIAAF